ncbi:Ku protein [Streptomyces sp. NBC_01754]|uniref:non-homologous end joining protein Ku n=1 Tax=Streptomyces sp. NBC_01754 TaxID=2975930 RepID=UPI002DD7FAB0|nr:Ku protein [Streptomyces sp. NBC_01754]WSC94814.1 Ku protein [Streptomyces sp. NBC_01754]
MRSIWNGAISFGLVSIPVKLMNATENHSISFRQIHLADGGRVRYRKVCELDEQEVTGAETGKAYEDADGTVIPITDEDLASLPLPTAKTIEIEGFVPASTVDPLQLDAAYYLAANGVPASKPYALLREALRRSEKVAVAKYALRGRERLGMLRVVEDVIALHGLLWPDEIRTPEGVAPDSDVKIRDAELDLADALMDTLGEVDLDTLHDDYREAVEELVAAKASGEAMEPEAEEEPDGGQVIDLMAALENSVRAAKGSQGGAQLEDARDGSAQVADVHPIAGRTSAKSGSGAKKKASAKKAADTKGAKGAKAAGDGKASEGSTAQESTGSQGTAKRSTAKKGTAKKSTAKETAGKKETESRKSPASKPSTEKQAAKKPSAKKQATKKQATKKQTAKKQAARKPTASATKKSASGDRGGTAGNPSKPPRTRTSA